MVWHNSPARVVTTPEHVVSIHRGDSDQLSTEKNRYCTYQRDLGEREREGERAHAHRHLTGVRSGIGVAAGLVWKVAAGLAVEKFVFKCESSVHEKRETQLETRRITVLNEKGHALPSGLSSSSGSFASAHRHWAQ